MVALIELVNLINICAQSNIMDVVMNYVALAVIADFDDFIFQAVKRGDKVPSLISDEILQTLHTTSSRCVHEEDTDLQCKFKDRSLLNAIGRIHYKICRLCYVSLYFYFYEFIVLYLILIYPIKYADYLEDPANWGQNYLFI